MYNPKDRSPWRTRKAREFMMGLTDPVTSDGKKNREVLPPVLIPELGWLQTDQEINFSNMLQVFFLLSDKGEVIAVQELVCRSLSGQQAPGGRWRESQLRGMGVQRREAQGVEREGGCGAHRASLRTCSRREEDSCRRHLGPRFPYDLTWEEDSKDHDQRKEGEPQACECQRLPRD